MTNFADRTIWTGDNLDILRGINSESVDLIYLDPPFNSNRNYAAPVGSAAAGAAFKDTWTLSDLDVAWMGLIADEQPAMYKVLEAAGLTHGKGMQSYLCMMAVRLLEMRRVLKDTGSIYLHCDPTASHYLKLLMDSVFGSGLFLNEMTWKRSSAHSDTRQGMRRAGSAMWFWFIPRAPSTSGTHSTCPIQMTTCRRNIGISPTTAVATRKLTSPLPNPEVTRNMDGELNALLMKKQDGQPISQTST